MLHDDTCSLFSCWPCAGDWLLAESLSRETAQSLYNIYRRRASARRTARRTPGARTTTQAAVVSGKARSKATFDKTSNPLMEKEILDMLDLMVARIGAKNQTQNSSGSGSTSRSGSGAAPKTPTLKKKAIKRRCLLANEDMRGNASAIDDDNGEESGNPNASKLRPC